MIRLRMKRRKRKSAEMYPFLVVEEKAEEEEKLEELALVMVARISRSKFLKPKPIVFFCCCCRLSCLLNKNNCGST
ncbi:unnamed protein product [Coffea canephora]|uniref:Uncharacterized protein n=1 Tax=Coffea canephora TaxID=49390 RepID=A0A068TX08_COFCA|nr:unnamed protein product [Coffea canephora]